MEQSYITDVSPRDGLQNQPKHVDTQVKLELIRRLALAGVRSKAKPPKFGKNANTKTSTTKSSWAVAIFRSMTRS